MRAIEVDITDDMVTEAKDKAAELGKLNNSIRGGKGNIVGFLGELAIIKAFPEAKAINTYDADLELMGYSMEVKTKDRTVAPRSSYEASVANFNTRQNADLYVFVSLLRKANTYVKAYVVGYTKKPAYIEQARRIEKGDIDPSNGWAASADCWNMEYSKLKEFKLVVDENNGCRYTDI